MAKKLGILALVVCMLLSVAVVASAADDNKWLDSKEDGKGPTQAVTNLKNPYGTFEGDAATENLDKALKYLHDHGYGESLTSYTGGHLWGLASGDLIVNDTDGSEAKGAKDDEMHSTLTDWRKTHSTIAAADQAFEWTPKLKTETSENVTGITVAEDGTNKVTVEHQGWKRTVEGNHAQGGADHWARTCVICGGKEEVLVATVHTPKLPDGEDYETTPTCKTPGKGKAVCSVCGNVYSSDNATATNDYPYPALGHKWENKTIGQSCTTAGGHGDICTRCGVTSSDVSENAAWKEEFGKKDGHAEWVANEGKALGHQWELSAESKQALVDQTGKLYNSTGTQVWGGNVDQKPDFIADPYTHPTLKFVCTRANCTKDVTVEGTTEVEDAYKKATYTSKDGKKKVTLTGNLSLNDPDGKGRVTLTIGSTDHAYADEASYKKPTCVLKGRDSHVCVVCGLEVVTVVYADAPATGHSPEGSFFHDNTTHEGYAEDGTCETAGQQSKHYQLCSVCGEKVLSDCNKGKDGEVWKHTPITPNCTTGGSMLYECTDCGYKENVPDPDNSDKLKADDVKTIGQHYGYQVNNRSTDDEKLAKWTTTKVTEAASCTKPGTTEYTCKDCGKVVLTKTINGAHDMVLKSSELQNCTNQWVEYWVCSRSDCPGITVKVDESGEDAHGKWTATVQTIDGKAGQRRVYAAHAGHTYASGKFEVEKEPTCVAKGERYPICDICGLKGDKNYTDPTGDHQYTAMGGYVDADCTHPARRGSVCKVCGKPNPADTVTDVEDSQKLGHNYANPTYYTGNSAKADAEEGNPDKADPKPTSCKDGYWIRTVCTRCGDYAVEEHKPGQHTWSAEAVHKPADCTKDDRNVFVCTVCGTEDDDGSGVDDYTGAKIVNNYQNAGGYGIADPSLAKTGHTWGDWKVVTKEGASVKNTEHERTCTVCGAKDPTSGACVYEKDKDQSKDATCESGSVTVMVCEVCKNSYTEYGADLDPTKHVFEDVPLEGHEPTCTESGTVVETCPYCGATGKTKEIDPLGHAWERKTGDWTTGLVITQEPTCVADGVAHRECSICGFTTEDFTVGKYDGANTQFGHTWTRADYVWSADQLLIDVEPTCTVDGTGHYVCADCGYELTTGIPHYDGASTPWGHTWNRPDYVWSIDQLTISTEPTCVADGEGYYECSDCGYHLVVPVPHYDGANTPYGHVWAHEAWPAGLVVNEDGTYYYQCSDCGYLFQEQ